VSESGDLISPEYRTINRKLHKKKAIYGAAGGKRWHKAVKEIAEKNKANTILDYGCGKGSLCKRLPDYDCRNYDPAIERLSATPEPADLVVCTDVLEHVEPGCLDNVLADIYRCTDHIAFLVISNQTAKKNLSDGRNAHLIVESGAWWVNKIRDAGFKITGIKIETKGQLETILTVKRGAHAQSDG